MTRALQLPPDIAVRAGDSRISRTKRGRILLSAPYSLGVWAMSSAEWVDSPNLAPHVEWVLEQLEPRAAEVGRLIASGVVGSVFCYWNGNSPVNLPKQLRARAAALGMEVDVDDYFARRADYLARRADDPLSDAR